ncbi:hypothetical protein PIB30_067450 [Stylosanthes scabra]|uniref:RRM domain-containing protein n=1 Tax=Stylosanthes scabra TaxID=79078 RepID=A0ABU6YP01_9FABA|nr:hypothetical protein [Stylosanthes scabra]
MRFAFVRYVSRAEAMEAIEQYNGWIVWGCELRITESKYRRHIKESNEEERGITEHNGYYGNKVEVVNLGWDNRMQSLEESKIKLESDEMVLEKLGRCLVGVTLEPYDLVAMKKTLKLDWHTMVDVKMMGSLKVLMEFDSVQSREEAYNYPFLWKNFLEKRRWTKGETSGPRRAWVEVTSIPLHALTTVNMTNLGEIWGRVIKVQDDDGGKFNSFKFLVDTNSGPMIQAFADIEVEDESFRILAREVEFVHTGTESVQYVAWENMAESAGNANSGSLEVVIEATVIMREEESSVKESQPELREKDDEPEIGAQAIESTKDKVGQGVDEIPTRTNTF